MIVRKSEDPIAEEGLHDKPGFRPLDLERRDIRLANLHAHARMDGDSLGPKEHITVSQGQPEVIFTQAQQHGIINDPAILGSNEHIFTLANPAPAQVPWGKQVGESKGIRSRSEERRVGKECRL